MNEALERLANGAWVLSILLFLLKYFEEFGVPSLLHAFLLANMYCYQLLVTIESC